MRIKLRPGPNRKRDARNEVLSAFQRIEPEGLRSLREQVFPLYLAARPEILASGPEKTPHGEDPFEWAVRHYRSRSARSVPARFALRRAFTAWAARWDFKDAWMLDAARETLRLWSQSPTSAERLEWQSVSTGLFKRPATSDERRLAVLHVSEFRQEQETPDEYGARVKAALSAEVDAFVVGQKTMLKDAAWPSVSTKRPEHFDWLARYHLKRESLTEIAASVRTTPPAVLKAIHEIARLTGFTLRKPLPGKKKRARRPQ